MNSVCLEQQGTQQVTHSKRHVFSSLSLLEALEIINSHRQVCQFQRFQSMAGCHYCFQICGDEAYYDMNMRQNKKRERDQNFIMCFKGVSLMTPSPLTSLLHLQVLISLKRITSWQPSLSICLGKVGSGRKREGKRSLVGNILNKCQAGNWLFSSFLTFKPLSFIQAPISSLSPIANHYYLFLQSSHCGQSDLFFNLI